jgi:hypothetical protein
MTRVLFLVQCTPFFEYWLENATCHWMLNSFSFLASCFLLKNDVCAFFGNLKIKIETTFCTLVFNCWFQSSIISFFEKWKQLLSEHIFGPYKQLRNCEEAKKYLPLLLLKLQPSEKSLTLLSWFMLFLRCCLLELVRCTSV